MPIESESTQEAVRRPGAKNLGPGAGSGGAVAFPGTSLGARRAGVEIGGELHEFLERLFVRRTLCRGPTLVRDGTEQGSTMFVDDHSAHAFSFVNSPEINRVNSVRRKGLARNGRGPASSASRRSMSPEMSKDGMPSVAA